MRYFLSFFVLMSINLTGQNTLVSGYITDENGEQLPGAIVQDTVSKNVIQANNYGYYAINLLKIPAVLEFSFVGMERQYVIIESTKNATITVKLKILSLKEFVLKENRKNNEKISSITLPIEQIKKIPSIGGETDIIKALGLTPGVSNGTEGSAGLFVRGGTPDQNLILLDDAVVYNPNHLFGMVSVFNTDAVKNVELIKGGFPARYGGRLSSVLDVTMKEGSLEKKKTDIGIGIIGSRLTIERPLIKNKLSLLVAARSSYLTLLLSPLWFRYNSTPNSEYFNYWMYDANVKLNYRISDNEQLIFSFYRGSDESFNFRKSVDLKEDKSYFNWGNTTMTFRYNKSINQKIFWKTILSYSDFGYQFRTVNNTLDSTQSKSDFRTKSGLYDFNFKTAFDYFLNNRNTLRFGVESIIHNFTPQSKVFETNIIGQNDFEKTETVRAFENSAFVENEVKITDNLKSNFGLRINNYRVNNKSYYAFEPRLSVSFNVNDWIIKGAYSKMQQNIHLLTSSGVGYQNDIWVPSTELVKPQKAQQMAFGISKYFKDAGVDFSLEVYYKTMTDLIDYKEGSKPLQDIKGWETTVERNGTGSSKGLEIFLNKKTGRLNGFLSYTLAKTDRQFTSINNGEVYPFRYDARHNIALTFNYQLSKKWDVSATFVYKTGEPITVPIYIIDGNNPENQSLPNNIFIYSKRNAYRMPDYHRADVAFNRTTLTKKGRQKTWSFSFFNVYNRANPAYVIVVNERIAFDRTTGISEFKQTLQQKSIFSIIPSVTYALSF
jgi:TonB dependent receptor/TonB-dependent Receptor Plug Domain/CarboxypepD_reg-like domain